MFSLIARLQVGSRPLGAQRIGRRPGASAGRLLLAACLSAIALCALGGTAQAFAATPTVAGVSPDTGPPAGGTTVTVKGSGFALGASATRITFGEPEEVEATGVNCPTTTECTATSPELPREGFSSIVDVRATADGEQSAQTLADQFEYHGLLLEREGSRLNVGEEVKLAGLDQGNGVNVGACTGLLGGTVVSNGQATDVLSVEAFEFPACTEGEYFGVLPFSFSVRLGDDESATIEGPVGLRTGFGCVYEGNGMAGNFEYQSNTLFIGLGATLPLVGEKEPEPEVECEATQPVFVQVGAEQHGQLETDLIGAVRPEVTGLSPGSGPKAGGTTVTLTGAGLGEASAVRFGSQEAASFTVNSPSSITAVSPPGEGTVAVTVTGPRGTGTDTGSGDKFTYGPAVSGVEPDHGPRAGETAVTITGVNLEEASAVTFGTTPATSFKVVSPTSVTAVSPPGTGTVDVRVSTPEGTSPTGTQDRFSYDIPPPTITEVSPASGPEAGGTSVTVSGTDFNGATAVKFGATNAASFKVNSDSSLTAVSPGGTGTVDVSVTTPRGTSTAGASDHFTYEAAASGLPEFGRCAKVTPVKEGKVLVYHGTYETAHCTTTSPTHEGKYEWSAGPGADRGFTGTAKVAKFETRHEVDHLGPLSRITCTENSETGEFTGPRTAVATITFNACVDVKSKAACQSSGQPAGVVKTVPLDGELGVIKGGETPVIGIALRPHDSTVLTNIECGASSVIVEGAVIAPFMVIDAMSIKHTLAYKGLEGAQSVTAFEGEPPETLSVGEPMSLTMTMPLTGAESLEIKAIG
jgi:hypothetical protein